MREGEIFEIMSKTDIWMPLYIADYLADTTRLTTEQHGAYLLLIMDYWRNGPLPDDDGALSNITRLSGAAWKKNRASIAKLFHIESGEWHHKRIDKELEEAAANARRYAERAKKAAGKRWGKQFLDDATSNATSIPNAMLDQCTSPSPSPSPSNSVIQPPLVKTRSGVNNQRVREESPPDGGLTDGNPLFTEFWNLYPRKVGKDAASRAFAKIKRPSETMGAIRSALAWQVESEQWTKNAGQYIPNPATYLNQGRWADEPPRSTSPPAMTAVGQRAAKAADRWLEGEGFAKEGTA